MGSSCKICINFVAFQLTYSKSTVNLSSQIGEWIDSTYQIAFELNQHVSKFDPEFSKVNFSKFSKILAKLSSVDCK